MNHYGSPVLGEQWFARAHTEKHSRGSW